MPWSYEAGKTYSYVYSVQTTTSMKGTSNQESVLELKASVELTVNTACDFSMKVWKQSLTWPQPYFVDLNFYSIIKRSGFYF